MKNILVTGGAGAIGSRLVRRLLAEENVRSVFVLDDLSSGFEWLLPEDGRITLMRGDVASILDIDLALERPVVFHLAALFANQNSVDHPLADLRTNGQGTLATLLWARRHQATRFVYASAGCSIAGHHVSGPVSEDLPVSLHLDTPYQITKALGEFYCNYFNSEFPTVRCRFFNSYGPGELPGPYRNVIPNFIWKALHGDPLVITGSGEETRDFIYVDDLVEGLFLAATAPEVRGEAFNLGTGKETKILDLARLILEACDSKSRIEFAPRRPWDKSLHRQAEVRRAKERLKFQTHVSLCEGIKKTVRWFRDHSDFIETSLVSGRRYAETC